MTKLKFEKRLELEVEKQFSLVKKEMESGCYDNDFIIKMQIKDSFKLELFEIDFEKQDKENKKLKKEIEKLKLQEQKSFEKHIESCDFYKRKIERLEKEQRKNILKYIDVQNKLQITKTLLQKK